MNSQIRIGSVVTSGNVLLAPMSGVTDQPFRRLVKRFGCGLVYSEMIASREFLLAHRKTQRMSVDGAAEAPIAVQLAGCEPDIMAEAARITEERGAAIIDINMGCPVKKVVTGWAGSALMRDEDQAARIIEAVVKAVRIPGHPEDAHGLGPRQPQCTVTGQTRGIRRRAAHHGPWTHAPAALHRLRRLGLHPPCQRGVAIPVVGNGDVCSPADARELLRLSGADGVMIGRGAFGKPWFPAQVMAELDGAPLPEPTLTERRDLLLDHYDALLSHYGRDKGVRIARKHLAWSAFGISGANAFRSHGQHRGRT
jgi:tRNA-dihydrouridine synthase B